MKLRIKMVIVIVNILTIIGGMFIFTVDTHLTKSEKMERAASLPLEKDKNPEVTKLIEKFINAKFSMNKEELKDCVNDINEFSDKTLKEQNALIEKIESITCYTVDGYHDNSYIAVVYKKEKIKNMDVIAPSVVLYYVCEYGGKLVVFSGEADDAATEYWNVVKNTNKAVLELAKSAVDESKALEKKYPEYKALIAQMNGTATPTPKPTATPKPKPKSTNKDQSVG